MPLRSRMASQQGFGDFGEFLKKYGFFPPSLPLSHCRRRLFALSPSPFGEPSLCSVSPFLAPLLRSVALGSKPVSPSGLVFSPSFGDFGEFLENSRFLPALPPAFALQTQVVRLVSFAFRRALALLGLAFSRSAPTERRLGLKACVSFGTCLFAGAEPFGLGSVRRASSSFAMLGLAGSRLRARSL